MNYTTKELAEALQVDYSVAVGLIALMVARGAAKVVGKRPTPTGKGKPSVIYEVPASFTITIPQIKTEAA